MLKWVSFIPLIFFILSACASRPPTHYKSTEQHHGLMVDDKSKPFMRSSFSGNSATPRSTVSDYSKLGAIEYCFNRNALAVIADTKDQSFDTVIPGSPASSYTVPGYSNFNGKTVRDFGKDRTYTHPATGPFVVNHPIYTSQFTCITSMKYFKGTPSMEDLSRELVSPFAKDFKGGILLTKIAPKSSLKEGDVLIAVGDQRVERSSDLTMQILRNPLTKDIENVTLIRNRKIITIPVEMQNVLAGFFPEVYSETQVACKNWKEGEPEIEICKKTPGEWMIKIPQLLNFKGS